MGKRRWVTVGRISEWEIRGSTERTHPCLFTSLRKKLPHYTYIVKYLLQLLLLLFFYYHFMQYFKFSFNSLEKKKDSMCPLVRRTCPLPHHHHPLPHLKALLSSSTVTTQGVWGFILAGFIWFSIPNVMATTTGMAYLALSHANGTHLLTADQIDQGHSLERSPY